MNHYKNLWRPLRSRNNFVRESIDMNSAESDKIILNKLVSYPLPLKTRTRITNSGCLLL